MRVKCTVWYDGTYFYGFQIQNHERTIQGEIQKALKQICQEDIIIHASGRTDAKVHAVNQVFHFDTQKEMEPWRWQRAINHFMPEDIYIKHVEIVDETFHSRYSAVKKEYRYYLNTAMYNPFLAHQVYQYGHSLDILAMQEASTIFLGKHNFASFCWYDQYGNTIRTLFEITILEHDGIIEFRLIGDGFRRYMVRHIVGGLIQVGAHRISKNKLKEFLDSEGQKKCLYKAKPQGLYLYEVTYDEK